MFAFDGRRVAFAAAMLLIAVSASAEPQTDSGRVAILQHEAERLAGMNPPITIGGAAAVGAALGAGLLAYLGTYLGIKRFSFGRMREKDGWREVTYRFRSSPLAIKSDTLARMTGILEDLEQYGAALRPAKAAAIPAELPRFARREERQAIAATASPAPAASPVPATSPAPAPAATIAEAVLAAPAPAAPVAVAPTPPLPAPIAAPPARDAGYRRARSLLDQGFDLETVRAMTGLKRAEIDLVRCAPPHPAPAS